MKFSFIASYYGDTRLFFLFLKDLHVKFVFAGAATIVGSLVGFVGGGAFMKAARLEQMRQFLKYLSLLSFLTLCGTFSFMLRCANQSENQLLGFEKVW